MLTVSEVTKRYSGRTLFENVTTTFDAGKRYGLASVVSCPDPDAAHSGYDQLRHPASVSSTCSAWAAMPWGRGGKPKAAKQKDRPTISAPGSFEHLAHVGLRSFIVPPVERGVEQQQGKKQHRTSRACTHAALGIRRAEDCGCVGSERGGEAKHHLDPAAGTEGRR